MVGRDSAAWWADSAAWWAAQWAETLQRGGQTRQRGPRGSGFTVTEEQRSGGLLLHGYGEALQREFWWRLGSLWVLPLSRSGLGSHGGGTVNGAPWLSFPERFLVLWFFRSLCCFSLDGPGLRHRDCVWLHQPGHPGSPVLCVSISCALRGCSPSAVKRSFFDEQQRPHLPVCVRVRVIILVYSDGSWVSSKIHDLTSSRWLPGFPYQVWFPSAEHAGGTGREL